MKKSNVISLSFFIVTIFLSMISSELFHVNPQTVIASKDLVHRYCNNIAIQYTYRIPNNNLCENIEVPSTSSFNSLYHNIIQLSSDTTHPPINITNPSTENQTILSNFITINGKTSGASINKVEAYVSKVPLNSTANSTANYNLAIPITQGNWSRWSFPVVLKEPGTYLVISRVTDNAGDENWADVRIHFPGYIYTKRIAFVEPTFTYAAYRFGSFYNFYEKYSLSDKTNNTITTDLTLLKNRPIPHGPFPYYAHPTEKPAIPYIQYFTTLLQHVYDPLVTNITDVDVHQGKIFQTNGSNAYDVLFLFHNEYATQSEYNNLRQFVSNGGTIVFTEANTLFAEVSYNKTNDSITLVKGHTWNFDGKSAVRSIGERWLDENREWMGSNYLDINTEKPVHFRNNPFNYKHTEEQYVTNPEAKILIDYRASYPKVSQCSTCPVNATVATYQMNYGEGKIINLGIWGHTLEENKVFLNYIDNVIIPLALGPAHKVNLHQVSINITNPSTVNSMQYLQKSATAECIKYDNYTNTITVTCNANLTHIDHVLKDRSVLEKEPHGVWVLNAIIKVNPLATLTINHTDTSWLKITNKNNNEPNFVSISGNAKIEGVKITSWDPFSNHTIKQNVNGSIPRPYILVDKGRANISNSEVAFLGYGKYPSNGFVYEHGGNRSSIIINNTFHDMWDGFYSDSVGFITIKNNKYYDNLRYGIDPHTRSHDLSIIGNMAYNNTIIGIICSENCQNILFDSNTVHDNGEAGLMFSLDTNNSTAKKNYAYNENVGIFIFQSSQGKVYNNKLKSSHIGIEIAGNSLGNHVYNNTIMNNTFGFYIGDKSPRKNLFENNNLSNITYPIKINGINNIGRNNSIYNK